MLLYQTILILIFFVRKISNGSCSEKQCRTCIETGSKKINGCICSHCSSKSFKHKCTEDECYLCETFDSTFLGDCYCKKCEPEKEEMNKNNKYSNIIIVLSFLFSVIFIFIIILFCCLKSRKKKIETNVQISNNNQVNNRNDRNIRFRNRSSDINNYFIYSNNRNVAINVDDNIYNSNVRIHKSRIKEITLNDILADEKYLGPKKCKKEYEKYNIECTICLEKFKDDIDIISLTPCYHLFHNKCLNQYFRKNKNAKCPNCKYDIINHYKKNI